MNDHGERMTSERKTVIQCGNGSELSEITWRKRSEINKNTMKCAGDIAVNGNDKRKV